MKINSPIGDKLSKLERIKLKAVNYLFGFAPKGNKRSKWTVEKISLKKSMFFCLMSKFRNSSFVCLMSRWHCIWLQIYKLFIAIAQNLISTEKMDYKFGLPLKKDGAFANLIVIAVSVLSGMFEKKSYHFEITSTNLR